MFLYKQVPAERLSGLNGNHASRGVWGSALRANLLNHREAVCLL